MDALVYDDTPLATYFEAEAIPYDLPQETAQSPTPFAPHGLPDLKDHLRTIRRRASGIARCSRSAEQLIERWRYIVVASQLLIDEGGSRPNLNDHESSRVDITTLRGALVTAATSFIAAWTTHWVRSRKRSFKTLTWLDLCTYTVGVVLFAAVATFVGRWQYTHYLQRSSVKTLSQFVHESHSFDSTANSVVRFIQEVEVVARGYELGPHIPPVSRLEDRQVVRRCQTLRRELAAALKLLTIVMVESHNILQPYVSSVDVQRYHDIYDVSIVEYSQAIDVANYTTEEAQDSLKDLRFSLRLHSLARKVFLCDLLALRQNRGWAQFHLWSKTLRTLRELQIITNSRHMSLSTVLAEEEWGGNPKQRRMSNDSGSDARENVQDSQTIRLKLRRLDDIVYSVRALNAKMHLVREEVKNLTESKSDDTVIASTISKQYDSLGSDLRNLMSEWERGKQVMSLALDQDHERISCASSSVRTPASPSPSLPGVQIVDGGPADALRLLTGDSPSSIQTKGIFEEEVFEAVASRMPRKRMSMNVMTREEKIARLQEERRKRATMQEHADTTTNMLRELQMVIKHRPKTSQQTNRVASV